jgi:hypothetical protein
LKYRFKQIETKLLEEDAVISILETTAIYALSIHYDKNVSLIEDESVGSDTKIDIWRIDADYLIYRSSKEAEKRYRGH